MTNLAVLDIEQTLYLHDEIVEKAGGKHGIRDFTLLHSALERCKVTFAGEDLYPSLFEKAGALLHSLVMNHPFLDANKRTGFAVMTRFLNTNDYDITAGEKEIVQMSVAVDNEGWGVKEIVQWFKKNTQKIR